jgi:hypothetical protein
MTALEDGTVAVLLKRPARDDVAVHSCTLQLSRFITE